MVHAKLHLTYLTSHAFFIRLIYKKYFVMIYDSYNTIVNQSIDLFVLDEVPSQTTCF